MSIQIFTKHKTAPTKKKISRTNWPTIAARVSPTLYDTFMKKYKDKGERSDIIRDLLREHLGLAQES